MLIHVYDSDGEIDIINTLNIFFSFKILEKCVQFYSDLKILNLTLL